MNNFIDWETLPFKKQSGKEKMRCPACDEHRTDKKDRSLLVNHNEGYGKCFYCESLTFKDSSEINKRTEVDYKLPSQNWKNYTKLSDAMVKWIESRKIPQSTAIELGWTEEKHYQPQLQKEVNNIVFNFFEGNTLVNKKYRSGNKKFTQSAGTKSIFYNINSAIGQEEVYIVEGEMDCASLHSIGIKNVISVPNGANDNDEYWKQSEPYLKHVKKFVIGVDNDEKGNELKEKIAQRLGRWRCEFIEWEGKDANEDLISGVLEKTVLKKQRFPVSGTFTVSDLMPRIIDLYDNGLPSTFFPKSDVFGRLKDVYCPMRGQVNIGTGIPSHGKSNFTDWYVLNLINDYNLKGSWFSPEHSPMELYQTNLIEKVTGKNFWGKCNGEKVERVTKEEIAEYEKWANERIYLTDAVNGDFPTWDWLFEKFKEQMYSYGVDIFVIDAFNKVLLPNGNKLEEISKVLTKLTHFAQSNNVMIFLIAHPTKMRKDEQGVYAIPTLYDVSGSADFRNMTHNGYTIYRLFENETGQEDETLFINMKTKFSFQGKMEETVSFKYFAENGRFYANGKYPRQSLINPQKEVFEEDKPLPTIDPLDAFEDSNEIPF
jgi:twinkle protein